MKKLLIILFISAICLSTFSTQNKLSAQSLESSCVIEESDLYGYEMWEENSHFCWHCEIDGDPEPVYDQWGNYIGLLYNTSPVSTIEDEVICMFIVENETEFCHQRRVYTSSDDECHPLFVPDTP